MENQQQIPKESFDTSKLSKLVVGGGCFWCVQATLQQLRGVIKVESGYAGGSTKNPTYQDIGSGKTGHAQVVRVHFDPTIIQYQTILYIFMDLHGPNTLNRQVNNIRAQYRYIILYQKGNKEELQVIKAVLEEVRKDQQPAGQQVTQVKELQEFHKAQQRHQNYYNNFKGNSYCSTVIKPKLGKLKDLFKTYIDSSKL